MAKKQKPKVSVLERRLENPFGSPSVEIHLKDGLDWSLRVINSQVRTGRFYTVIHDLGWEVVTPDDLECKPEELGFRAMDGRVVRGERGEEILVKMPKAMYDKIQLAKADKNIKGLGKKQTLETAANMAAGSGLGDQAAETIYNSNMSIKDERVLEDVSGENAT